VLRKLIWWVMATKHIMQDVQDDIPCCMGPHGMLPGWSDWLDVSLTCYGAVHKDWPSKCLLADCRPHCAHHWLEWQLLVVSQCVCVSVHMLAHAYKAQNPIFQFDVNVLEHI
jgi:hypothetical protein